VTLENGFSRNSGDETLAPEGQKVDSSGCNPEKDVDGIMDPIGVQLRSYTRLTVALGGRAGPQPAPLGMGNPQSAR